MDRNLAEHLPAGSGRQQLANNSSDAQQYYAADTLMRNYHATLGASNSLMASYNTNSQQPSSFQSRVAQFCNPLNGVSAIGDGSRVMVNPCTPSPSEVTVDNRPQKKNVPPRCSIDGCNNNAAGGGICRRHGGKQICKRRRVEGCTKLARGRVCISHGAKRRKRCSFEGCTNQAKQGGVCVSHGANHTRCSFEGCTKQARTGGVCVSHGAICKRCSVEGCTKQAQKGGVCFSHGAICKRCSFEGCTNQAKKGGVCVSHGAKHTRCSVEGCTNQARTGGVCVSHGAKRTRCSVEGCNKQVIEGGVCISHGAKYKTKKCSAEGCTNQAKKGGVCVSHGAICKRCSVEGCTKQAQKGGVCVSHGAKAKRKNCKRRGCSTNAQRGGLCFSHAPKEQCSYEGCDNIAQTRGYCRRHGKEKIQMTDNLSSSEPRPSSENKEVPIMCRPVKSEYDEYDESTADESPEQDIIQCSYEGCDNIAQKRGYCCRRHGKEQIRSNDNVSSSEPRPSSEDKEFPMMCCPGKSEYDESTNDKSPEQGFMQDQAVMDREDDTTYYESESKRTHSSENQICKNQTTVSSANLDSEDEEELGAFIYKSSRTARMRAEAKSAITK